MNGDQRSELIVTGNLIAYVFFGRAISSPDTLTYQDADRTHTEPDGYAVYGWAVADLDDITGNGRHDYAITDYRYPPDSVDDQIGMVWIYRDNGQLITKLRGETAADYLGWSVASAGDQNDDDVPDILIGAVTYEPDMSLGMGRGKAYVYSGASPTTLLESYEGKDPSSYPGNYIDKLDFLGSAVAGNGDFDGDGSLDLLVVGNAHRGNVTVDTGTVFVYSGATGDELLRIYGNPSVLESGSHQYFGLSVSFLGDVNSDGADDILVGSPHDDEDIFNGGRIDIYVKGCCIGRRGNVDCDTAGVCDLDDLFVLYYYVQDTTGTLTLCCAEEGDLNDDGVIDISDVSFMVDYLFYNGQAPSTCSASN